MGTKVPDGWKEGESISITNAAFAVSPPEGFCVQMGSDVTFAIVVIVEDKVTGESPYPQ